jgi:ABC-type molybdate transport system substrate-binding protein
MSRAARPFAVGILAALLLAGVARADELSLYAAGSLTEAMGEIAREFGTAHGIAVKTAFGPSGLMRERIEHGEKVDVFASADLTHPLRLKVDGRAETVVMFTRNAVCAYARSTLGVSAATLLDRMLDPSVKIGTSTPKADPLGDYTLELFHRADGVHPGAEATLLGKAQAIFGGAANNTPTGGLDPVTANLKDGRVGIVFAYCSNRERLAPQLPDLTVTDLPPELRVGPEYGLAVMRGADPRAKDLALFVLAPEGQAILAKRGFQPVTLPQH